MKGPLFYSKILLFGEYGIIKDSKGLSIPYNFYNGALKLDENPSEDAKQSNESLKRFVAYLKDLVADLVVFDFDELQSDVDSGMYFDSSIKLPRQRSMCSLLEKAARARNWWRVPSTTTARIDRGLLYR